MYGKPYLIDKLVSREARNVGVNEKLLSCRQKPLSEYTLSELRNAYYLFISKYRFDFRPTMLRKKRLLEQTIKLKLKQQKQT